MGSRLPIGASMSVFKGEIMITGKKMVLAVTMVGLSAAVSAQTYQRFGNTTFGSDGYSSQRFGNTTFGSDGTTQQRFGNTTFGSDGTTYQRFGNTTFGSDGSTHQRFGNTTFGK